MFLMDLFRMGIMLVKLKMNFIIIVFLVMNCCYVVMVCGEECVEFNIDVLDVLDCICIDLLCFVIDNYVISGDYLLDICINGQLVGQEKICYVELFEGNCMLLCISGDLLNKLVLKEDVCLQIV